MTSLPPPPPPRPTPHFPMTWFRKFIQLMAFSNEIGIRLPHKTEKALFGFLICVRFFVFCFINFSAFGQLAKSRRAEGGGRRDHEVVVIGECKSNQLIFVKRRHFTWRSTPNELFLRSNEKQPLLVSRHSTTPINKSTLGSYFFNWISFCIFLFFHLRSFSLSLLNYLVITQSERENISIIGNAQLFWGP